jgi:hypothetical protein
MIWKLILLSVILTSVLGKIFEIQTMQHGGENKVTRKI